MRQEAGQKRRFKKAILACAVAVGILFLPAAVWWTVRYCRVEIAIHGFASNPSQVGTRKLITLLEKHSPTQSQAARMLKLLLWPKVAVRSAYPMGKKPTVSVAVPFYLQFRNSLIVREDIPPDGQSEPRPYPYRTHVSTMPDVLVCPVAPDKVGKFHIGIQYRCLLAPAPEDLQFYFQNPLGRFLYRLLGWVKMQPGLSVPEERWYQVRFCVPVDIDVVEPANAEQVRLLSNPELDRLMRGAFSCSSLPSRSRDFFGLRVSAKRPPMNAAFRYALELSDGTRISSFVSGDGRLYAYAGRDLDINVDVYYSRVNRPGTYDAKFVFEPDPNYAFEEPTIKSIWNGKLEFPIHFTVAPEPNLSEQQDPISPQPAPRPQPKPGLPP